VSYVVTLKHIRYGKQTIDLVELKRRLETRISIGLNVQPLRRLLGHAERLIALIDILDAGRESRELRKRMDTELAFLLLAFDQVQAIMTGAPRRRPGLAQQRKLPGPKPRP
jgi:hypothetical protein